MSSMGQGCIARWVFGGLDVAVLTARCALQQPCSAGLLTAQAGRKLGDMLSKGSLAAILLSASLAAWRPD